MIDLSSHLCSNLIAFSSLYSIAKRVDTVLNTQVDISSLQMESWRQELMIHDEKILVSFCWVMDDEVTEFSHFPEFLAVDVTFGTNRNSRNVCKVVGVDSSNKLCTYASCFMGSKQRRAYSWLFDSALPKLLGRSNASMTSVVCMDNEEMMNQALMGANAWCSVRLRLDFYHLFLRPWILDIPRYVDF